MAGKTITLPEHDVFASDDNPMRACGICVHLRPPSNCSFPYIVEHHGAAVRPGQCCDFFERKPGATMPAASPAQPGALAPSLRPLMRGPRGR